MQDSYYLTSLVYHLLSEISRLPLTENSSAGFYVEKAQNFISESFYLIKNNQQIASQLGLNVTYLEKIYKKNTGHTLWDTVTNCRLAAAVELLQQAHIPILEIDNMIGFSNRQTFYLQFKNKYHMSPSAYRKEFLSKHKSGNGNIP